MITQIGNREVNLVYEMENGERFALVYFKYKLIVWWFNWILFGYTCTIPVSISELFSTSHMREGESTISSS